MRINRSVPISLLLFLSAGTIYYWQGWVFMLLFFIPMALIAVYLFRCSPELLKRRLDVKEKKNSLFRGRVEKLYARFNEPIIPIESIEKWLNCFDEDDRATALMLVEKIEFHSQVQFVKRMRSLHAKLQEKLALGRFDAEDFSDVDFSREFTCKSGDVVSYVYRKANLIPEVDFKNFDRILWEYEKGISKNNNRALVILDDYIGTGSQFIFHFIAENEKAIPVIESYKKIYLVSYVIHESAIKKFVLLKEGNIEEVINMEKAHFPEADFSKEEEALRRALKKVNWLNIELVYLYVDRPLLSDSNNLLDADEKKKVNALLDKYRHAGYSGAPDLIGHHTFFYGTPNALPYILWPLFKRVEDLSPYTVICKDIIAKIGKVTRYNIDEVR